MTPMLMPIADVSRMLGIGEAMIRRSIDAGELPVVEIGRRRYVAQSDLPAFIERKKARFARRPGLAMEKRNG